MNYNHRDCMTLYVRGCMFAGIACSSSVHRPFCLCLSSVVTTALALMSKQPLLMFCQCRASVGIASIALTWKGWYMITSVHDVQNAAHVYLFCIAWHISVHSCIGVAWIEGSVCIHTLCTCLHPHVLARSSIEATTTHVLSMSCKRWNCLDCFDLEGLVHDNFSA